MKRIIFILTLLLSFGLEMSAQCDPPSILWDEEGLIINWIAKDNATGHLLDYRESGTFLWTTVTIPSFTTFFDITILDQCVEYDFRVKTICDTEESPYSSVYKARPSCSTCYDEYCPPKELFSGSVHITSFTIADVTQVSTFDYATNGYEDFRGTTDRVVGPGEQVFVNLQISDYSFGEPLAGIFIDFNRNLEFEPEELALSIQYDYGQTTASGSFFVPNDIDFGLSRLRVVLSTFTDVVDACDFNAFSGEIEDYCIVLGELPSLCDVDFDVTLEEVNSDGARFTWESLQLATAYNVRYKKTSESEEDWIELATLEEEIDLGNLDECTEYEFEVRGVCPFDTSSFKNNIVFNSFCLTSTETEDLAVNSISSFPNPWSSEFTVTIDAKKASTASISLISNTGQVMATPMKAQLNQGETSITMGNVGNIPSGMYFIKVTDEDGNSSYHKTLKIQ